MNDAEREAVLARLREFADQQREASEVADRGSLERAADVVALYEEKAWVREIDPPKQRRNRGRPVDPESFSRFTKWLGDHLPGRTAYRLREAHELAVSLPRGKESPTSARSVLPLKWLRKQGRENAIPEVWAAACKEAGGTPTEEHVKRALKRWKDEHGFKAARTSSGSKPRLDARAEAAKLRAEIEKFMDAHPTEFVELWEVIDTEAQAKFDQVLAGA